MADDLEERYLRATQELKDCDAEVTSARMLLIKITARRDKWQAHVSKLYGEKCKLAAEQDN